MRRKYRNTSVAASASVQVLTAEPVSVFFPWWCMLGSGVPCLVCLVLHLPHDELWSCTSCSASDTRQPCRAQDLVMKGEDTDENRN